MLPAAVGGSRELRLPGGENLMPNSQESPFWRGRRVFYRGGSLVLAARCAPFPSPPPFFPGMNLAMGVPADPKYFSASLWQFVLPTIHNPD